MAHHMAVAQQKRSPSLPKKQNPDPLGQTHGRVHLIGSSRSSACAQNTVHWRAVQNLQSATLLSLCGSVSSMFLMLACLRVPSSPAFRQARRGQCSEGWWVSDCPSPLLFQQSLKIETPVGRCTTTASASKGGLNQTGVFNDCPNHG